MSDMTISGAPPTASTSHCGADGAWAGCGGRRSVAWSSIRPFQISRAIAATGAATPPDAVVRHHISQQSLAQSAIGNAHARAGPAAANSLEDGAAGKDEIGTV